MDIRSLEGENSGKMYDAFMAAFADYSVPIAMSPEEFAESNARRGLDLSISPGAYSVGQYEMQRELAVT